jgi:hypothetical protein
MPPAESRVICKACSESATGTIRGDSREWKPAYPVRLPRLGTDRLSRQPTAKSEDRIGMPLYICHLARLPDSSRDSRIYGYKRELHQPAFGAL